MQDSSAEKFASWPAALKARKGPKYLAIVELIKEDVREGRLKPGEPLLSQRALASLLKINFTTVGRAYEEAEKQGLVQTRQGQGTFIAGVRPGERPAAGAPDEAAGNADDPIDLSTSWPPNLDIAAMLADEVRQLTHERSFDFLARRKGGVPGADRSAGQTWLQPRFDAPLDGRVAMASGTRNALIALFSRLVGTGGRLMVESMCWPTVRTLAAVLGIELVPVALDAEGLSPEALDEAAQKSGATALYCVPSLQNPTGAVMGLQRRQAVIEVARRRGITLIEDDAYGGLQKEPQPLLGALAPDITYSLFGLAKLVSPSLRVCYVVTPDAAATERLVEVLRATMQSVSPLEGALATHLIHRKMLVPLIERVRTEASTRQQIAHGVLDRHGATGQAEGLFCWLPLPARWDASEFAMRLRGEGVLVAAGKSFALAPATAPNAIRIATGAVASTQVLSLALQRIDVLLRQNPSLLSTID
ncbi:PLP-dependent aminotransferase family protein [Pseudorhodoferax soli]|uniref:GntR family transcriptional regulator n=1 Tax=Pseudorhodoferax soli TaxID=545864 RepID=A0A368XGJ3_9BURK|nr:PLP-dependent aminotransferase family protein [Pseudorhodoferax soli]RCW65134.1 GntR family transcriptional regulator [Pseudorhodoferax soli]